VDRSQKEATVAALHRAFAGHSAIVVTHQLGMTVEEVTDLRRKMRAVGAGFKVTKNRLARIALKGTPFEGMDGLFTGPTAVAFALSQETMPPHPSTSQPSSDTRLA